MAAQADILAQIAGGGLEKTTPKYGDVQKNQLSLDETRAKSNDLKITEANRMRQEKDARLYDDSLHRAAQESMSGSNMGSTLNRARDLYIKGGGGNAYLMGVENGWAKVRQETAKADDDSVKAIGTAATQLSQGLAAYQQLPPDQQEQARPMIEQELRQTGHLGADEPLTAGKLAVLIGRGQALKDISEKTRADADAKKAATESADKTDEIAGRQAKRPFEIQELQAKAAAAPELQNAAILKANADALKVQQETEGTTPISPEQQVRADQAAATLAQTAARDAATNANAQANTQVARGRLAEEIRKNNMATAELLNSGLAGVPKNMQNSAAAAATKVGESAAEAQQAADDMKTFIDLARSGNKVAYAYAPTEGVLTLNTGRGVKRVNMAEIQSYAGSGSTIDKVQGWLGGHISGESIPPQILDAMQGLHEAVAKNAANGAQRKLDVVNQMYGSNFKMPGASTTNAAPVKAPPKVGERRTYSDSAGKQHTVTFLGGNPADQKSWKE